ncbi:MAG: branched-chain amino acid ABC transporter permease, partial [Mycobacterium sp.]|nr:branched-chain amino acid ABC transporter permease [Mycobacterium sp.]
MTSLVQTLILGLLVGALYALMASGLTLIFGVMRVINLAHGAFAVLAAFLTFTLWRSLGLDPLLSIPIVMVVMFGLGWLVYVLVIRHVRGAHVTMTVLATFGIALMLEGIMGFVWGNTSTTVVVSYTDASLTLGSI